MWSLPIIRGNKLILSRLPGLSLSLDKLDLHLLQDFNWAWEVFLRVSTSKWTGDLTQLRVRSPGPFSVQPHKLIEATHTLSQNEISSFTEKDFHRLVIQLGSSHRLRPFDGNWLNLSRSNWDFGFSSRLSVPSQIAEPQPLSAPLPPATEPLGDIWGFE